mgnify:CR=1 FL=1
MIQLSIDTLSNDCDFVGKIESPMKPGGTIAINSSDEIFLARPWSNIIRRITDYDKFSSFPSSGKPRSEWIVRDSTYVKGPISSGYGCGNNKLMGLLDLNFTADGTLYGLDYYCNKMVKISGPTGISSWRQDPNGYLGSWSVDASFGSRGDG